MNAQQPEALRLAHVFDHPIPPDWSDMVAAASELRRLHDLLGKANVLCRIRAACIKELEAQLEAIGAGGAEPLKRRVTYVCPVCAASLERQE